MPGDWTREWRHGPEQQDRAAGGEEQGDDEVGDADDEGAAGDDEVGDADDEGGDDEADEKHDKYQAGLPEGWTWAWRQAPRKRYRVLTGPECQRSLTIAGAWRIHLGQDLKQQDRVNTVSVRKRHRDERAQRAPPGGRKAGKRARMRS